MISAWSCGRGLGMSRDENITAVQRACKQFSAKHLEGFLDLYSPSVALYGFGDVRMGVFGLREYFGGLLLAFPDMRIESHNIFGEGEIIAHQFSFCGTHKGMYMGVPPTNEFIYTPGVMIHVFERRKCVEAWLYLDRARFVAIRERFLEETSRAKATSCARS
jgi:predicted ester cyclase